MIGLLCLMFSIFLTSKMSPAIESKEPTSESSTWSKALYDRETCGLPGPNYVKNENDKLHGFPFSASYIA
ncbi:hypothetical protein RB195_008957 [Necator americanus]|uniref:Uncharacterized protein n=1 Tax=Necator americanus TaxID=51031 RepID=A0ABR1CSZ1_NECAM